MRSCQSHNSLPRPGVQDRRHVLLHPLPSRSVHPLFPTLPHESKQNNRKHTFGRFTFGIITSLSALGASFLGLLGSPCGWYWYWASPPVFQGSVPSALPILFSEDEEVGFEEKCQPARPKAPDMIARRI